MRRHPPLRSALTLVEILVTTALIGVLGLVIFSVLNTGTILGAKNTAVNTAHQQARTALLQITQTLHSAVSFPQLFDEDGKTPPIKPAVGISFQVWAGGPYKISADTTNAWTSLQVNVTDTPFTNADPADPLNAPNPPLNQRVIIPGYSLEADIKKPSGTTGTTTLTPLPSPFPTATPTPPPIEIKGTGANYNVCFITSRCYYVVTPDRNLEWHYTDPATGSPTSVILATGIDPTNSDHPPFKLSGNDVLVTLATEDANYSNQWKQADGFKFTKVLLSETIPIRANLTIPTATPTPTPAP